MHLIKLSDIYTLGRIPVDEASARHRDVYLIAHNTHKRQIFMPQAGFEPAIPASERPQTHTLDRTATRIGQKQVIRNYYFVCCAI